MKGMPAFFMDIHFVVRERESQPVTVCCYDKKLITLRIWRQRDLRAEKRVLSYARRHYAARHFPDTFADSVLRQQKSIKT